MRRPWAGPDSIEVKMGRPNCRRADCRSPAVGCFRPSDAVDTGRLPAGGSGRQSLFLHGPLIGNDLTRNDLSVKRHSLIARSADLDVVVTGRQSQRLRRGAEVADRPDGFPVDENLGGVGRDVKTHASTARQNWTGLD